MRLGPLEITLRKEMPKWLAPRSGPWFDVGVNKRGPKSESDALDSVVGWSFACVDAIASRAASIPYRLFANEEPIEKHIFYDLWNKPNEIFPAWHMRYLLFAHLCSGGKAVWYLYNSNLTNPASRRTLPAEVWPLMPDKVDRVFKDGGIHYYYHAESGKVELDPERVLYFSRPSVSNLFGEWSPLRAAGVSMDISEFIDAYQWNWFKNGSWYPYALTTDQQLQSQQLDFIRDEWMARFRQAKDHMAPVILHSGMKAESAPIGGDLDLSSLDESARDKVLGAFRTPKSKLGYSESANKASMFAADKAWNEEVIEPLLTMVDSVLDQKWLPIYGNGGRLTGSFDSPVPTDREELRADIELGLGHGVMTDNEAREMLGLQPIPDGDVRYKPFNLMPVGETQRGAVSTGMARAGGVVVGAGRQVKSLTKAFWTPEKKDAHWFAFDKAVTANERRWHGTMYKLFSAQEAEVKRELDKIFPILASMYEGWSKRKLGPVLAKESRIDQVEQVINGWNERFTEAGLPIMTAIYEEAGKDALDLVSVGPSFDIKNPRAVAYLNDRSIKFAQAVNGTTAKDIRKILSDSLMEGESIDQMSEKVAAYYNQARDYRSDRIARTETIASTNAGSFDGYYQGGVQWKAWLSARDQATRMDHLELDSKYREETPIGMDEPFVINGDSAMFPGEFSNPAQTVNCRCTFIPVYLED